MITYKLTYRQKWGLPKTIEIKEDSVTPAGARFVVLPDDTVLELYNLIYCKFSRERAELARISEQQKRERKS